MKLNTIGILLCICLLSNCSSKKNISTSISFPDKVIVTTEEAAFQLKSDNKQEWKFNDITVKFSLSSGKLGVDVSSPTKKLRFVSVKWAEKQPANAFYLGDHWERTYGDIKWHKLNPKTIMPWYFLVYDGKVTNGFGVMTGCHSFAQWKVASDTMNLNLDIRNGSMGVNLGQRILRAADIIVYKGIEGDNWFASAQKFCKAMCPKPRLPKQPVYGINDWYFCYGKNSRDLIMQTVKLIAPLAKDNINRPFCLIDEGWALKGNKFVGQSDCSYNYAMSNPETFGNMADLANDIKSFKMRPGLWTRPLMASADEKIDLLLPKHDGEVLDPTVPENIERIKSLFKLYRQWGFDMVKFDYSTYDLSGKWGFQMLESDEIYAQQGWNFKNNSLTTAEVILNFYQAIRDASPGMYIIACNTVSHLAAGYFELQRIGDDTSGKQWARVTKMGVNTLAMRSCQQNNFYAADPDCVGLTTDIPWEENRQWMQLVAESGTPLFISAQPQALGDEQKAFIEQCFDIAAKTLPVAEPLDWKENFTPSKWKLNGKVVNFNWGN